jgi:hypothetical protein
LEQVNYLFLVIEKWKIIRIIDSWFLPKMSHVQRGGMIHKSRHSKWCDSFWVPKGLVGPVGLTWQPMSTWKWATSCSLAWLLKSRRTDWSDPKGLDLKKNCGRAHFSNINKKGKNRKNLRAFQSIYFTFCFCNFNILQNWWLKKNGG